MKDFTTYTCGIIEDEELAYSLLKKYINRIGIIDIKWWQPSAKNLSPDSNEKVDIVFLDLLDSPLSSATTVGNYVNNYGQIIITTAHTEVYINSLGIEYINILNKPFSYKIFESVIADSLNKLTPPKLLRGE